MKMNRKCWWIGKQRWPWNYNDLKQGENLNNEEDLKHEGGLKNAAKQDNAGAVRNLLMGIMHFIVKF